MVDQPPVAWAPFPGSQALALGCPCDEILYHGTRGPGKTTIQLAKYASNVGRGYGTHWRGVIFDRGYKNLDDLIAKSEEMFPKIFPGARFLTSKSDLRWEFPDGETLLFRHMKVAKDYRNYHGHEYPYIGWNELTSFATSELYDLMKSCNRSSFVPLENSPDLTAKDRQILIEYPMLGEPIPADVLSRLLPEMPLLTFSTTNPHGPGHNWVKKKFIDRAPPGVPAISRTLVFNPRTQQEEYITTSQVHIFGSYKENRKLNPKYVVELNAITDPNKRRAWLGGDWSITSGGALDDLWNPAYHVLPRFIIPKGWDLVRSFDWGSTHPFSVGFWAIANGEEVILPGGKRFCPPAGSIIRFGEIYGCQTLVDHLGKTVPAYGANKGLKISAREVARRIVEAEEEFIEDGWIHGPVAPGPADKQIFSINEAETNTLAAKMELEGISWHAAQMGAGSRKSGLELMRIALEAAVQGEGAGMFVMSNCEAFIETVPGIPRNEDDPDDVDTTSEDHIYDEARYMLLDHKPSFAGSISVDLAM